MNEEDRQKDFQRLLEIIALEEERGSLVPGGAVGGIVGRARRQAARSASLRARMRVRSVAHAVSAPQEQAA
jgi:hypothetical protein